MRRKAKRYSVRLGVNACVHVYIAQREAKRDCTLKLDKYMPKCEICVASQREIFRENGQHKHNVFINICSQNIFIVFEDVVKLFCVDNNSYCL